jgi:hypothetical protein
LSQNLLLSNERQFNTHPEINIWNLQDCGAIKSHPQRNLQEGGAGWGVFIEQEAGGVDERQARGGQGLHAGEQLHCGGQAAVRRGDAVKWQRCMGMRESGGAAGTEAPAGDRRTAAAAQPQPYRSRDGSGGLVADNVSIFFFFFHLSSARPSRVAFRSNYKQLEGHG